MSNNPHEKLSREEMAKREIGVTDISPKLALTLTVVFCLLICVMPLGQEIVDRRAGRTPQHWDAVKLVPTRAEIKSIFFSGDAWHALKTTNSRLLADIRAYETGLKDQSFLVQELVPRMQVPITGWLKGGNEDAYVGRDGWLFYRRDIDHLIGKPFLSPRVMAARAAGGDELTMPPQPDPLKAILDFRTQLAARGIKLLVVPVPGKPSIQPERFSARYTDATEPVLNPSCAEFIARLRSAGIAVCEMAPVLWRERQRLGRPVYLATDTHWTPEGMEAGAQAIAAAARAAADLPAQPAPAWQSHELSVTNLGDSAGQLRLPAGQEFFHAETVTIQPVDSGTQRWRSDPGADVLFLGDSFSNIYSLDAMGWGEAAGLPERLSLCLGRPLDCLLRNDAGSYATRRMLADNLARGRDRLAGKRLVIWEFAMRELSFGDWKMITLKSPAEIAAIQTQVTRDTSFFVAPAGQWVRVSGTIDSVSSVPVPGSVPYKDHRFAIHLVDLQGVGAPVKGNQAVVYMWDMRDNKLLRSAKYRPGDRVTLNLKPWSDVMEKYEAIKNSDLDSDELMLQDPNWGEEITK